MGKMARQQKYKKAGSDMLKARLKDIRRPGDNTSESRAEAVEGFNEVKAPNTKSKNWVKDRAYDSKRVAGPAQRVKVEGMHSDYEFDVEPGSTKKDVGQHISRHIVKGFEDTPKNVKFN